MFCIRLTGVRPTLTAATAGSCKGQPRGYLTGKASALRNPGGRLMTEPRWLNAEATARYICVRVDALQRLVRQGRIPKPNYSLGPRSPRWDREALDSAFNGGTASTNVRLAVEALVQEISQQGPRRSSHSR